MCVICYEQNREQNNNNNNKNNNNNTSVSCMPTKACDPGNAVRPNVLTKGSEPLAKINALIPADSLLPTKFDRKSMN